MDKETDHQEVPAVGAVCRRRLGERYVLFSTIYSYIWNVKNHVFICIEMGLGPSTICNHCVDWLAYITYIVHFRPNRDEKHVISCSNGIKHVIQAIMRANKKQMARNRSYKDMEV